MYYSCFYAVSALLTNENIDVSSHSGLRQKFGEKFVKSGKFDQFLAKHFTDLAVKEIKVTIMISMTSVKKPLKTYFH